ELARLPRGRLVHRRPRATQRFFDLLARLEQVGPGLLARLALERAGAAAHLALARGDLLPPPLQPRGVVVLRRLPVRELPRFGFELARQDRKSTRLNSSHGSISYAVFCLKKKKRNNNVRTQYRDNTSITLTP